jgi:hypothetical protein
MHAARPHPPLLSPHRGFPARVSPTPSRPSSAPRPEPPHPAPFPRARTRPSASRLCPAPSSLPSHPIPPKFGFVLHICARVGPNWVRFARLAFGARSRDSFKPQSRAPDPGNWLCFCLTSRLTGHDRPSGSSAYPFSSSLFSCMRIIQQDIFAVKKIPDNTQLLPRPAAGRQQALDGQRFTPTPLTSFARKRESTVPERRAPHADPVSPGGRPEAVAS